MCNRISTKIYLQRYHLLDDNAFGFVAFLEKTLRFGELPTQLIKYGTERDEDIFYCSFL